MYVVPVCMHDMPACRHGFSGILEFPETTKPLIIVLIKAHYMLNRMWYVYGHMLEGRERLWSTQNR